jgi:hypothetical protein
LFGAGKKYRRSPGEGEQDGRKGKEQIKLIMTDRELIKLEATIRKKMEDIAAQRVSLRDSGIGSLMNTLKKADEAAYERIMPAYKKMVAEKNIFR